MTAEEILDQAAVNSPVKSFLINDGNVRNIALSAMEQQAVAFAEWCDVNDWEFAKVSKFWFNTSENVADKTTVELYQLFNQQN